MLNSQDDGRSTINLDPIFFLKFGSKENLESLQQKGLLYMKNFQYFIDLEKENSKKGRGDTNEVTLVMHLESFQLVHPDTQEVVLEGTASKTRLTVDDDRKKPIFCMSYLDSSDLEITKETNDFVEGSIVFSNQQKEEFISEFGEYVLVFSSGDFINTVTRSLDENDIDYAYNRIKYTDYSVNHQERIASFIEENDNKYFWKDISLEYQKEFRLVILNQNVDSHFEISIGDMSSYSSIIPAKRLLNGEFSMRLNFKKD